MEAGSGNDYLGRHHLEAKESQKRHQRSGVSDLGTEVMSKSYHEDRKSGVGEAL